MKFVWDELTEEVKKAARQLPSAADTNRFLAEALSLLAAQWSGRPGYACYFGRLKDELHAIVRTKFRREGINERCEGQPAGTPVTFDDPYIAVVLSPAYRPESPRKPTWRPAVVTNSLLGWDKSPEKRVNYFNWLLRYRDGWFERRAWFSTRLGAYIQILEHETTHRVRARVIRRRVDLSYKASLYFDSYEAAAAYTPAAEERALSLLKSKVSDEQYQRYFTTGFFVEKSRRTGLTYVFRRLRPVLVFREERENGEIWVTHRFLAALCVHPQGYYSGTWAGTMVPTDDVVAQLLLMRSDERMLWRKATQHPAESPQADF